MTTIHTKMPIFEPAVQDMMLSGQMGENKLDNLELIDALIDRAVATGVEVQFQNGQRILTLEQARDIRHNMGLDIR
jgi:hypothetical protein